MYKKSIKNAILVWLSQLCVVIAINYGVHAHNRSMFLIGLDCRVSDVGGRYCDLLIAQAVNAVDQKIDAKRERRRKALKYDDVILKDFPFLKLNGG